jgi:hypothetical protein
MYKKHNAIETPCKNTVLLRYMSVEKYFSLIEKAALYFTRSDLFKDKEEGKLPDYVNSKHNNSKLHRIGNYAAFELKKRTFVSCWTKKTPENMKLWEEYTDCKNAIIIESNIQNVIESLKDSNRIVHIGLVNYVIPQNIYYFKGNFNQLFFEKEQKYVFEDEVRIISNMDETPINLLKNIEGIFIKVDLVRLIKKIILAPYADDKIKSNVESLLGKQRLEIPVCNSIYQV